MASVVYEKTVSDQHLHVVLQRIADLWGKTVTVHSGDRNFVPKGGSTTSLHLAHRAADFHVQGMSDQQVYEGLTAHTGDLFDPAQGYELIRHGQYTETGGPHVHLGHYNGSHTGQVMAKTEGLTPGSGGTYNTTAIPIGTGHPIQVAPPTSSSAPISGTVGEGGSNLGADVKRVQQLLNTSRSKLSRAHFHMRQFPRLAEDGLYGPQTKAAIAIFQKDVAGLPSPDGVIEPGHKTIRVLLASAHGEIPTLRSQIHHARTHAPSTNGGSSTASASALVADRRIKAMLDVLAFTEGTGTNYGKVVNGRVISSPNYPDLVGKTNVSVTNLSRHPDILVQLNASLKSTAAGRYQFLKSTWDELGMPDFSATSQDTAAVRLMQRRGMIAPLLAGNLRQAVYNGAPEWASLPTANGGSYYGGQPSRSISEIETVYNNALKNYPQ